MSRSTETLGVRHREDYRFLRRRSEHSLSRNAPEPRLAHASHPPTAAGLNFSVGIALGYAKVDEPAQPS
jgi:hypothetical protein